jgi:hypothetical protein
MKWSKTEKIKLATEKVFDFSMIAKRQTRLLMCGLTVMALALMSSSNQPMYDKPTRITTRTRARSAGYASYKATVPII